MVSYSGKIAVINFTGVLPPDVEEAEPVLAAGLSLGVCLGRIRYEGVEDPHIVRVLHPDPAKFEPMYFATSSHENINKAIRSLRLHEGYDDKETVGYFNFSENMSRFKDATIAGAIRDWAYRQGFGGVIWLDLTPNIPGLAKAPFSNTRSVVAPLVERDVRLLKATQNYIKTSLEPSKLFGIEKSILRTSGSYIDSRSAEFKKSIEDTAQERMALKQTDVDESLWYNRASQWGPNAKIHEAPAIPGNIDPQDHLLWKRKLVVALALKYQGLQYCGPKASDPFKTSQRGDIPPKALNGQWMRGHFPGRGYGLDCSNFVSWIYNLAGIHFTSDCGALVDNPTGEKSKAIGRSLAIGEKMILGDLIFLDRRDPSDPNSPPHVIIYCGSGEELGGEGDKRRYYIDSTSSSKVGVVPKILDGSWCEPTSLKKINPRFVRVTRPIE